LELLDRGYGRSRQSVEVSAPTGDATMHIENSYSAERAEEIPVSVRSLMRHLATKLSE
jgi:hypothetical protein